MIDDRSEALQRDIDQTRAALRNKMERVETKIQTSVGHTREQVRQSIDIKHWVRQHPWKMLGAAVVAGFFIGRK